MSKDMFMAKVIAGLADLAMAVYKEAMEEYATEYGPGDQEMDTVDTDAGYAWRDNALRVALEQQIQSGRLSALLRVPSVALTPRFINQLCRFVLDSSLHDINEGYIDIHLEQKLREDMRAYTWNPEMRRLLITQRTKMALYLIDRLFKFSSVHDDRKYIDDQHFQYMHIWSYGFLSYQLRMQALVNDVFSPEESCMFQERTSVGQERVAELAAFACLPKWVVMEYGRHQKDAGRLNNLQVMDGTAENLSTPTKLMLLYWGFPIKTRDERLKEDELYLFLNQVPGRFFDGSNDDTVKKIAIRAAYNLFLARAADHLESKVLWNGLNLRECHFEDEDVDFTLDAVPIYIWMGGDKQQIGRSYHHAQLNRLSYLITAITEVVREDLDARGYIC
jgi:hypothetical protein